VPFGPTCTTLPPHLHECETVAPGARCFANLCAPTGSSTDWKLGVVVIDLDAEACVDLMRAFIREHPDVWSEDIGED
jgi:hypothetical protein